MPRSALFAAGFAFRPLGAIIFGVMGDRVGRKATFLTTVSLMGGATFAIGLLPTYEQAGMLAPILLIFLRICQGTALGGEYGGAAIYVAEHATNDKRGAVDRLDPVVGVVRADRRAAVILATRTALGEEAFARVGLAHPLPRFGLPARHFALDAVQAEREPGLRQVEGRGRGHQGAAARGVRRAERTSRWC